MSAETLLRVLMGAKADHVQWMDFALCAETDPEAFFVEKSGDTRPAKAVCLACPVRLNCLDYAVENRIAWGIWGGLSPRQRRTLLLARSAA